MQPPVYTGTFVRVFGDWTTCTKACGGGEQSRTSSCISTATQASVGACAHVAAPDQCAATQAASLVLLQFALYSICFWPYSRYT